MTRRLYGITLSLVLVGIVISLSMPRADADEDVPPPSDCTVTARNITAFIDQFGASTPVISQTEILPESLPKGKIADLETVASVEWTFWEVTACVNKGSILQLYALFSDRYFARNVPGVEVDELRTELLRAATPLSGGSLHTKPSVWDVRILNDGRVGAFVAFGGIQSEPGSDQTRYVFFTRVGDRWLIDEMWSQSILVAMGVEITPPVVTASPQAQ